MSVKWKTMKVVFRYSESTSGPIIKPQWPFVFDLIDDSGEEDLIEADSMAPGSSGPLPSVSAHRSIP